MGELDRVTVPPPDEVATRTAREAELGVYLRGFRARHDVDDDGEDGGRRGRQRPLPQLLVLLLAGAALALPALATRLVGPGLGVPLLLVPFGALVRFLWRSFRAPAPALRPGQYVYLYERGLVCPGQGGTARAVPWRSVTAMHQDVTRTYLNGGYTGTHYAYRLRTGDRRGVTVGGFLDEETAVPRAGDPQIRELAQIVLDETVRRALPPAVTALEEGERVVFGEVALHAEGIGLPSGKAPWERVRRLEWRGDGLVVVRTAGAGRWAREAKDIPDFPVFWTLVKELFPDAREVRR
ncbi:DUF6585 family protein [Streptomyces sp. NPDC126499]|uniref:DUF6585 family protein n=1 Tax=Streptomyces sp. NPDC126499 TaxID=3155314 RepID=UPI00331CD69C